MIQGARGMEDNIAITQTHHRYASGEWQLGCIPRVFNMPFSHDGLRSPLSSLVFIIADCNNEVSADRYQDEANPLGIISW